MNAPVDGGYAPLAAMWEVTKPWYGDRLDPDHSRKTVAELQDILKSAGLTADFWRLTR